MPCDALCRISATVVLAPLATTGSLAADPALRDDALALFEPIPAVPGP